MSWPLGEEIRAKTERALAKANLIKSLQSLGVPMESILEQVKDL